VKTHALPRYHAPVGTWGTGLYADDTALDLRSEWGEKMKWDGRADAVTEQLVAQYGDDDTTFWLALADLQWKCGHLAPRVRERALAIIANGADLSRRSDASAADQRARVGVLERLRAQLGTPPPAPRPYKRPAAANTKMKVGEVYSWRLLDGRHTFFQVAGITQGIGAGLSPELRIIDLVSANVPFAAEVAALPTRRTIEPRPAMEKIDPRWKEHPLVCFKIRGPRRSRRPASNGSASRRCRFEPRTSRCPSARYGSRRTISSRASSASGGASGTCSPGSERARRPRFCRCQRRDRSAGPKSLPLTWSSKSRLGRGQGCRHSPSCGGSRLSPGRSDRSR
jgi:hypothetical protein